MVHGVAATSDSSEDTEAEALEQAESQAKAKDMRACSVQHTTEQNSVTADKIQTSCWNLVLKEVEGAFKEWNKILVNIQYTVLLNWKVLIPFLEQINQNVISMIESWSFQ